METVAYERDRKWELIIRRALELSTDPHNIFIPFALCREVAGKIPSLNGNILTIANLEFLYIMRTLGVDPNRLYFATPCKEVKAAVAKKLIPEDNIILYNNIITKENFMGKKFKVTVSNYPYQISKGGDRVNIYDKFHRIVLSGSDFAIAVIPCTWVKSSQPLLVQFRLFCIKSGLVRVNEFTEEEIRQYFPSITIDSLGYVIHDLQAMSDTFFYKKGDIEILNERNGSIITNQHSKLLKKLIEHPLLQHSVLHKSGSGSKYRLSGGKTGVPTPLTGYWERPKDTECCSAKRIIVKVNSPSKLKTKPYPKTNIVNESLVFVWDYISDSFGDFDKAKIVFPHLSSINTLGNAQFIEAYTFACGQYCYSAIVKNSDQAKTYLEYTRDSIFWFCYNEYRVNTTHTVDGLNRCPYPNLELSWEDTKSKILESLTVEEIALIEGTIK